MTNLQKIAKLKNDIRDLQDSKMRPKSWREYKAGDRVRVLIYENVDPTKWDYHWVTKPGTIVQHNPGHVREYEFTIDVENETRTQYNPSEMELV